MDFDRKYDRRRHKEYDEAMEAEWGRRLAANPLLFNASKFRFHSVTAADASPCLLRLGLTNYKEFIGTNMSPLAPAMQEEGRERFGDPDAFMVSRFPRDPPPV